MSKLGWKAWVLATLEDHPRHESVECGLEVDALPVVQDERLVFAALPDLALAVEIQQVWHQALHTGGPHLDALIGMGKPCGAVDHAREALRRRRTPEVDECEPRIGIALDLPWQEKEVKIERPCEPLEL